MRTKQLTLLAIVSLALLSGACGGSQPAIRHRLPMTLLAQTPPEERGNVADAYRLQYEAGLQLDHITFMLSDIEYELKIARAKKAQRVQEEKVAKLEGKRSEAMFKFNLAKAAGTLLGKMKKQNRAEGERIHYLKAQRTYLRRELSHAKLAVVHAEAAFELAKAQLAKKRETVPKGFKLAVFVDQEKRTKASAQNKAGAAKSAQSKAKSKEQAWKNASK